MPEELMGIAALHNKRVLTDEEILFLYKKIEGWVTGLILILKKNHPQFLQEKAITGDNLQEVFVYFASEIFEKVDCDIQDFLLKTSFLPFVTAKMAEELTLTAHAGKILSELNREYFFTARHALREPTYQYHALFAEFLQSRATQLFAPSQIVELQNQSARILLFAEQVEEAIELYLKAGNWEEVTKLILGQAIPLLKQKRFQTLEGWLNQIPPEITQQSAYLIYLHGACRFFFATGVAREHFIKAFEIFDRNGDMMGAFLAWSGIVDTISFEWGDLKQLDRWIEWLDHHLEAALSLPLSEIQARVISSLIGLLVYKPEHPEGSRWIERAMDVLESEVDIEVRIVIGINLCFTMSGGATSPVPGP